MHSIFHTPQPQEQLANQVRFKQKTEAPLQTIICPKSPKCQKNRSYTTGCKHIIRASNNLNFEQDTERFEQDFEIDRIIGEGNCSIVYKVTSYTGHQFAIKRFKRRFRGLKDRIRHMSEIRKLALICSGDSGLEQYIIKYIDSWEEKEYLYIRTELGDQTLKDFIQPSVAFIDENFIWRALFQIAQGLTLIHSYDLIHLDINPSNIIIKNGMCKICDFGHMLEVGKEFQDEGDGAYMAPELLNGQPCFESDIFSLGLILLELATGIEIPVDGIEWRSLRQGILPLEQANVSQKLKGLIVKMTYPQPNARIKLEEILEHYYSGVEKTPFHEIKRKSGLNMMQGPPTFEVQSIGEEFNSDLAMNLSSTFDKL